jgi:hypothetical protein
MADELDDFESRLQAAEAAAAQRKAMQGAQSAPMQAAPSPQDDFESRLQAAEQLHTTRQAPPPDAPPPSLEEADVSAQRLMRMQALKAEIGQSVLNLMDTQRAAQAAQQAPSGIAEKVLQPIFDVGSSIGTMMQRAGLSKEDVANDPQVQQLLGARKGVPFDATTGASFMDRLADNFTFNRAETAYSLMAGSPNVQNVRFNQMGEPILEVLDPETGKTRDILANPVGMDVGDMAFVVANLPSLAGGFLAAKGRDPSVIRNASKAMRWLMGSDAGVTAASARAALGSAAGGVAGDALARGAMEVGGDLPRGSLDAPRIIAQHGVGAVADFLTGHIGGAAGHMTSRVASPFSRRGPIQIEAEAAQRFWEREGVEYLLTPAQQTGSPMLMRTEVFEGQKPGSAGVFSDIYQKQRDKGQQIQRIMLGTDPQAVPAADLVGEQALTQLGQKLRPLDTALDRATQDTLRIANDEIAANIANVTRIPQPVVHSAVGQNLFTGAQARHEVFETQRRNLYDAVTQDPRIAGQGRNIDVSDLAQNAQRAIDDIAAMERDVTRPIAGAGGRPLVGPTGQPLTTTVTEVTPLNALVDPKAIAGLEQMAQGQGARMGYADLIEARNTVGNAMRNARVLGGIPEARLDRFYAILSEKIRTGLDSLDNTGGLRQAWERANEFTRAGHEAFEQVDILPMFKPANQRGSLDVYDIASKALNDPGRWAAYRNFFGAQSPEMDQLKRLYVDRLTGRTIGSDSIDMQAFASRLADTFSNPAQREVLEDVFGSAALRRVKGIADAGAALEKGGNIPTAELLTQLQQGTLTRRSLQDMATMQGLREQTYRNSLLERFRKGEFELEPSKFVDNLVFSAKAEPQEVREVISLISDPQTRWEIAQRTLMRIFDESSAGPPGKETMRSSIMSRFIDAGADGNMMAERVKAAIGNERFKQLTQTRNLVRPADETQTTFKGAGGIAGGMEIKRWEDALMDPRTMPGTIMGTAQRWLLTMGYNYGPVRAWLSNNKLGPSGTLKDRAALVNSFVGAAPVVTDFAHVFGSENTAYGRAMAVHLKAQLDRQMREGNAQLSQTNAPSLTKPAPAQAR